MLKSAVWTKKNCLGLQYWHLNYGSCSSQTEQREFLGIGSSAIAFNRLTRTFSQLNTELKFVLYAPECWAPEENTATSCSATTSPSGTPGGEDVFAWLVLEVVRLCSAFEVTDKGVWRTVFPFLPSKTVFKDTSLNLFILTPCLQQRQMAEMIIALSCSQLKM